MILSPNQDCIPAWQLLLVCGASMFLVPVSGGGGLEEFLRKLEAAQRELELPALDAGLGPPQRERRNVVKRPGVSYERVDDDAVGLRGPGAGSDDADRDSLQAFDEPSDNEASDEAAILKELEEINSGSDNVKRGSKASKRYKRQRHRRARAYGSRRDDVLTSDQGQLYRDLSRATGYLGRQAYAGDPTYKEAETSKQFQAPSEEQYDAKSRSGHDLASPETGNPTLRMGESYGNTTADGLSSQRQLGGVQNTPKGESLPDKYISTGMASYSRNIQRSLLNTDSEMEEPDSHEEIFKQESPRKADNMEFMKHFTNEKDVPSSDISSRTDNEDDTPQGYHFRNLENELESDMIENERNGVPLQREHKMIPFQRNSLVSKQHLGQEKNGIDSGYGAPFSDKGVDVSLHGRIDKTNFRGIGTDRKKLSGGKLERWGEANNDGVSGFSNGREKLMYTGGHPERDNEQRTLVEEGPESQRERVTTHEKNSKYRKHKRLRYSSAPVATYGSKKQRKDASRAKDSLNQELYAMVKHLHSGRTKSRSSAKQKHPLRRLVGNDIAGAATKEQLILEDSPGNFDLFDTGHSSRQRSSGKTLKDDDSFHFLWDNQFESKQHSASSNETKQGNTEVHTDKKVDKNSLNASNNIQKLNDIEEQTSPGPREDPAMEDVHSGKTIIEVVDEVMRQVEKSKEVSKHLGPFLKRDHAAEAEVHRAPEATECGGHPCPQQLLSKLTNAVAEIVNNEVSLARCEPMADKLRCFVTWLLEGAHEEFRPRNPGYVDAKRLAFYAAYYKEPAPTPPVPPVTEHPPPEESSEGAPPCGEAKEKGTCAASKELENERERQIRLLKQLLKEYHALSAREQTRLHRMHQYLQQQLEALHAAPTAFTSATQLPAHTPEVGAEVEGMAEELATRLPQTGSEQEHALLEKPLEPEQVDLLHHPESGLGEQGQAVDQEAVPVIADEFGAEAGAAAGAGAAAEGGAEGGPAAVAAQADMEQLATEDALAQTIATLEAEEELIQKDLELLGLGNNSNFGTKFNLGPLGHRQEGEEQEEETAAGEAESGSKLQKRAASAEAQAQGRPSNATAATDQPPAAVSPKSPQAMTADHLLTDAEERDVLRPLLDNADSLQRRRR